MARCPDIFAPEDTVTEPPYSWSSPSAEPVPPAPGYAPPPVPPQGYQYGQPAWMQPGVVPLRPLALGELLDGAIKVIRRYPRPTLGLSAAIALAVTILNVISVLAIGGHRFAPTVTDQGRSIDSTSLITSVSAAIPAQLLGFVGGLVLTGALIAVVGRAVQGKDAPISEVWATVRPRIWALIGLALLTIVITFAPFAIGILIAVGLGVSGGPATLVIGLPLALAGFVASVYLYIRLSIAPAALVLERAGVMQSLRRSSVLVKGSWWRMFGILFLTAIIAGIVGAIIGFPLGIIAVLFLGGIDGTPVLVAQQVAGGVASVLIAPFSAGVHALLYVDRRMRAEGLDVALRASVNPGPAV